MKQANKKGGNFQNILKETRAENNKTKRKFENCEKKTLKKIQTKKYNPIFSVSTFQRIRAGKKAALKSAFPTHCKLSTEIVSVSGIVTGEGIFT